jgi:hypothetical protein
VLQVLGGVLILVGIACVRAEKALPASGDPTPTLHQSTPRPSSVHTGTPE